MKTARQRALHFIEASKFYGTDFGPDEMMHVDALEKMFKEVEMEILNFNSQKEAET